MLFRFVIFVKNKLLKTVLLLGANSDVAKQTMMKYLDMGCFVMAASRDLVALENFIQQNNLDVERLKVLYFDAEDFDGHQKFYETLPYKPHIVVYAAGFLSQNEEALRHFSAAHRMMKVNYIGAVSILNIIAMDGANKNLEKIIGLSSLSGVRGRKSNFVYGSTKSAFTQYLAGLRQELSARKVVINVMILGYIDSKINQGLDLNKNLIMQPEYVARHVVGAGSSFVQVPNWKWKIIYWILKLLPENLVSKLP